MSITTIVSVLLIMAVIAGTAGLLMACWVVYGKLVSRSRENVLAVRDVAEAAAVPVDEKVSSNNTPPHLGTEERE